ncbi:ubiquitin-specific protease doa4 [Ceratobasidium sp. 428]|nr:ubiquitin-specific protease doa4 [Ceratobasidium sp. 428]
MAKVVHVKDIREQAKSSSLQAVNGASALSIINSARSLADAGLVLEDAADLRGALYKYSQAANLLDHVLNSVEYKRETPKNQRGVLYHQTSKLSEYITGQMLPRARKVEERLREIELAQSQQSQSQSPPISPTTSTLPSTSEPDARPMGSIADRMRMLGQAGLNVGNADKPKPPPPSVRTKPAPAPAPAPPPIDIAPAPLDAGLNPIPLNSGGGGGGASSIQHDLGYLADITSGRSLDGDAGQGGNNRGVPPTNGTITDSVASLPAFTTPQSNFSPPPPPPPAPHRTFSPPPTQNHGMFSNALSPTSTSSGAGMFGISPAPASASAPNYGPPPPLIPPSGSKPARAHSQSQPPPMIPTQPPIVPTQPTPTISTQTQFPPPPPPPISQSRSPRSMSLSIPSPSSTANTPISPSKSPRPPVPPRLTPSSTGDRTPPLSRVGMGTPPMSRSALWMSPQTTGMGDSTVTSTSATTPGPSVNGLVPSTTGGTSSGNRTHPVSPLATGSGAWSPRYNMSPNGTGVGIGDDGGSGLGLGLGLGGMNSFSGLGLSHSPRIHDLAQLAESDESTFQTESQPQSQPQPPTHRRTNTADEFNAAFPSLDELEAGFDDVESRLMGASVPTSAPGTTKATSSVGPPPAPPSIGFGFAQGPNGTGGNQSVSPIPRPFPNVRPDLDSAPRPASTPATNINGGRPGVAFGSAKGAKPPTTTTTTVAPNGASSKPQREGSMGAGTKMPKPDLPITNIVSARTLKAYLATALTILVLDVRSRDQFDARRMPVEDSVCIEPIVLNRKGMSTKELQEALVLSSKTERTLFERRNMFDLVVLVDTDSEQFGDLNTPIGMLFRMIYEQEFLKPLRRSPVFLQGGIKAWTNDVGELVGSQAKEDVIVAPADAEPSKRLSRKPAVSRPASGSVSQHSRMPQDAGLSGSSFGTYAAVPRAPITYPERAVSPPTSTGTPGQSHRPIEDIMSPPPPSNASYFEPPHHAYSGSVSLATNRTPSIDYPHLIRPPPAAASPVMERVESRPRIPQPPKPPKFQPNYQVTYWRDEQLGMSGLRNLGNTCYMNSVLQCLSGTVPFTRFFTDGRWQHEVNMLNPLGTRGEIASAFYHLLRDMWQAEMPYLTPIGFRKSICQHARQFAGTDQHDSQEFLIFLLDGVHEDLNRIFVKPKFEELTPEREAELEKMPKQLAGAYEWARYRRRNDSIVVDYFQGQFCNQMQCLTCNETSTTYNAFLNLSVPIPAGKGVTKVSLTQCIDALVNKEFMDNADAWHCPRCKKARRAAKQLTLSRMPPVLVIHLKRFSFKGPFTDKLETLVDFPLQNLDFTNYMPSPLPPGRDREELKSLESYSPQTDPRCQTPQYKYELYGVTNHFGSLSSGHYTAFVKSRGKWLYCDDSRIAPADPKDVVGKPAYILFYKRVPPGQ